jgi:isoleucyl-tRNA synthetase
MGIAPYGWYLFGWDCMGMGIGMDMDMDMNMDMGMGMGMDRLRVFCKKHLLKCLEDYHLFCS